MMGAGRPFVHRRRRAGAFLGAAQSFWARTPRRTGLKSPPPRAPTRPRFD